VHAVYTAGMTAIEFSHQAKRAIALIENKTTNVFITGKAGTGKSTLLEYVRSTANSKTVVLAPTGVAAINVQGETIHSFFGLKPGFELDEAKESRVREEKAKRYQRLETIMIDEISMVRADVLDAIDIFLRKVRKTQAPFGGVQMVFFGDLYQLPPVVTPADSDKFYSQYSLPYFFAAEVFTTPPDLFNEPFRLTMIELDTLYRQTDSHFINLLNAVRNNSVTPEHVEQLNARCDPEFIPADADNFIHLVTTNADAARINDYKLSHLMRAGRTFTASSTGDIAKNLQPNDDTVTIKPGAQIMFIYNDPERKWVNGTIGTVLEITEVYNTQTDEMEPLILVQKTDGTTVEVRRYTWEISKYVFEAGNFVRKQIGSFTQIPLKLAWAITIHKSQGKTFEKVVLDLGRGSFAHGQSYVALSRCTSLQGLVLRRPFRQSDIIMDQRIDALQRVVVSGD
jgi:ATP-dependent DNA helicase PIF1